MDGESKQRSHSRECASCEKTVCLVAFCPQCSGMVCADCVVTHKAVKHLREEHFITMFDNFKQENLDSFVKTQSYCKETTHHKDKLEVFCREATCRRLICQKCGNLEHKDHHKVYILEETKSLKQVLRQDMKEFDKVVDKYKKETEKIRENMTRIQSQFDSAKKSVRGVAETAFKLIMDHEAEMIQMLNERERKQKTEFQKLQNNITSEMQNVSEIQHQYQSLLENDVAHEIIEKQNFLQKKCHKILNKEAMLLKKPMLMKRNVTVDYVTNPQVMQSLQNIGKLVETKPLDPLRCTIEALKEVRNGYFNELEFEIVTRDCDGEVCCVTENFEIKIVDQGGTELEKNAVLSKEEGKYRIVVTYKAEKKSPCEIQVNIGGERVKNSPQIVNI